MHTSRRRFLQAAALPLTARPSIPAFPDRQSPRALFPTPADRATVAINPPGFAWWRAPGAAQYRLVIPGVYQSPLLPDPVHLPSVTLPAGEHRWDVEACDASGKVVARRGIWRFTVPNGVPDLPWQDPKALLARVPEKHPRYIVPAAGLTPELKEAADKALKAPLPEPPRYHTFDTDVRRRMGYTVYFREFRRRVDAILSALSLAWLLGREERYGLAAKKLLLEIETWGIEGPMSLLSPYGDEPGLSMARHGQRAYDWLYDLFDPAERDRARRLTIARGRQILQRLRKADYLSTPAESHNGRLIAYLAEYAIVIKDEADDAPEWLDYSLRALTTFYPHWGDSDGGWAEGPSYALSYNTLYLPAIEALRRATGFDLYRRPFFGRVRRFFLYCVAPKGEMKPFGDGADRGGAGAQGAALMAHHGRRFQDPAALWWADQTGERPSGGDPFIPLLSEPTVAPRAPADLPQAAVFRGIGWAALHSHLHDPSRDTFFLFKSSPFGSVSHSHADQNGFAILKGGRALAIPSGYYGPAYGMPHHAEWTRQTKANNCVLVDGQGQVVRDPEAKGRIADFRHQRALTYVCGDAAAAYGKRLTRSLRHVLFLRPGVFLVLDDLAAPQPAQFSWLLHALEKMQVDADRGCVMSSRGGATLEVCLHSPTGLVFDQTDAFDTPYNEGNPPEYHEQVQNQWHFRARTERRVAEARIAALMVVRGPGEDFTTEWLHRADALGVVLKTPEGSGEAWIDLKRPGLRARWQNEELTI
jgi:hypothetical protein